MLEDPVGTDRELSHCLATWQLPVKPTGPEVLPVDATRLPDHRRAYLDYEGPISRNRGHVTRFDHGEYCLIACDGHQWVFELDGKVLRGRFRLTRSSDDPPNRWTFTMM
jgi:hypothetical protein